GLRSGDCDGQSKISILLSSNHSYVFFAVCFGSLSCWKMTSSIPKLHTLKVPMNSSFKISRYSSPYILPSILQYFFTPKAPIQPHIITEPPPNFTVGLICCGCKGKFGSFQHHSLPSEPKIKNLLSSDHTTFLQSSIVQSRYFLANFFRAILCRFKSNGFLFLTLAARPCLFNERLTVFGET